MNLTPIRRGVYTRLDEYSPDGMSEATRVLILVMLRLNLATRPAIAPLIIKRSTLKLFGQRWFVYKRSI
jgi:hypothetical protein